MASLKLRNNTWYAVWTQNGKQIVRTTNIKAKGAKEKKLAQNAATTMEAASKGNISVASAIDALRKTAETLGMSASMPSVKEYFTDFKPGGKANNCSNYARAAAMFLDFLGISAYKRLDLLTSQQCKDFFARELNRVSFGTVKHYKSMLTAALNAAVREGTIDRNPMSAVQLHNMIPEGTKRATDRQPFSMDEMRIIINKFPYPWAQLALTSYLTGGQRLGDIATLKWESIDFKQKIIHIRTAKTGKDITSPLVPLLEITLLALRDEQNKNEKYVFPASAQLYTRSKGSISVEFTRLLKAYGILPSHKQTTTGDRRPISPKSFHSIRHTVVSQMRCNPAITSDLSREIVGHDSEAVERGYFTAPTQAKLDAFAFLCKQLTPASDADEGQSLAR